MSTNALDLAAITAAASEAAEQQHLVSRTLVPPSEDRDDDLTKLWLKEHDGVALEVGARKQKPKTSLAEMLEKSSAFITAPLGRGKTSLRGLLARDLQPARTLLWVERVPGAADLLSTIERSFTSAPDGAPIRDLLAHARPVIAVDDWDQYTSDERHAFERQATDLRRGGSAFVFLGTPSAPPPRFANTRPLRLLPLTPADCTSHLYRRLEYPARSSAEDLANRLAPISREAFFISVIADYFASGRVDAEDTSLVALMRELMDTQVGSRCTTVERNAIGPWLRRLALAGNSFTLDSATATAQAISSSVSASRLLDAASDAGFLIRRGLDRYEFSHSLWRAFVVVDSFDTSLGSVSDSGDSDEEFARAQARLLPLAKTREPRRTEILRSYAKRDLSAYIAAVSTLSIESYDRATEQYVRSFVSGVEDIAHLLSPRARAFVEPWNGHPERESDGLLGAIFGGGSFEMRVRQPSEPQLISVPDARERTEFTPPAAVARGIGTSRLSGAKLTLEQLRSLWNTNVVPIIEPLAREQLFFWARRLQIHATPTTVADVVALANEHTDNLLFVDDAWLGGEYLSRWHRLNQRQGSLGISGPELLRLADCANASMSTSIDSLGHPGPDIAFDAAPERGPSETPYQPYQGYSLARKEERIRATMAAAVDAFHVLLNDDYAFLKRHSPLQHGSMTFHVVLESDHGAIQTWWEPDVSGQKLIVSCLPSQLVPSYDEIDRRVGGSSPGLTRQGYYAMGASLRTLDWSPISQPATTIVCKFLLKCLGDALGERFTSWL